MKRRSASSKAQAKGAIPAIPKKGESKQAAVGRVQKKHPGKKVVQGQRPAQ